MMTKRRKMHPHNSNEGSLHTDVIWFSWYGSDSAYALGQLLAIDYSDSTPDVAYTYDRLERQLTVTDVLGTPTNVYSPTDLLEERHPDGTAPSEGGMSPPGDRGESARLRLFHKQKSPPTNWEHLPYFQPYLKAIPERAQMATLVAGRPVLDGMSVRMGRVVGVKIGEMLASTPSGVAYW